MLTKMVRRLSAAAAIGILVPLPLANADEGYLLPSTSVFKNVGYTIQDPAPVAPPTGVAVTAPPVEAAPAPEAPMEAAPQAAPMTPAPAPVMESYAQPAPVACCPPPACKPTCCTEEKKKELAAAAKGSHKPLHYLNNFSYLKDPCYDGHLLGDSLKGLGHDGYVFDFGGQYRARLHREENHRGLGITGRSDDFLLHRLRTYMNAKLGDNIRVFAEALHADSNYETFRPRPIEENHFDLQNLFIDAKLTDSTTVRVGRQEIALGAQRYVSPLDWANTRRTFDGFRVMHKGDTWNLDGIYLHTTIRDFRSFDETNDDQRLYGLYATNSTLENGSLDLYWLAFDNDAAGFAFDSIGARYNGKLGDMLFEAEGAYQFGENADGTDHNAGFFTVGAGKGWADHSCKPTTWVYFDWASGDDQQGAGKGHHHFQPLAHKYNGFMDLYGRRNLIDFNILSTLQISPKVKLLLWYHNFWLANENDTPYSVNMAAQNAGVTPVDAHLGNELDTVLSIGITPRSNILFGYSRFWAGEYYDSPTLLGQDNSNANFFYTQYTLNF